MELPDDIRPGLIEAIRTFDAEHGSSMNQRRGAIERQREDSRQRLKACQINRATHEQNMAQAAQLEHRLELDRRHLIARIVEAHLQSPLTPDQLDAIVRWLESSDRRN